jgi:hypothetical protein
MKRLTFSWSMRVLLKLVVYLIVFVVAVFAFHYLLFRMPNHYPSVTFRQQAGEYALPNKFEYGVDSYIAKGRHEVSYQEQCRDNAGQMSAHGTTSTWWFYVPQYGGFVNAVNVSGTAKNQPLLSPNIPIRHGSCY